MRASEIFPPALRNSEFRSSPFSSIDSFVNPRDFQIPDWDSHIQSYDTESIITVPKKCLKDYRPLIVVIYIGAKRVKMPRGRFFAFAQSCLVLSWLASSPVGATDCYRATFDEVATGTTGYFDLSML